MKLSIITTIGNEKFNVDERRDAYREALHSYEELADEVIIVNGGKSDYIDSICSLAPHKFVAIDMTWPYEWSWEELPKHLNAGLEEASGDWVIKCDIDYIFHEKDMAEIRRRLEKTIAPIATFQKYSFITKDRFYEKGGIPIAINKGRYGMKYQFGQAINTDTDLCYPIRVENAKDGVPYGYYDENEHTKLGMPFYNYDYSFKTKEVALEEFWRFAKAYQRYFGVWKFGDTKEKSSEVFLNMMRGRLKKSTHTNFSHPKYIKDRIESATYDEFIYDGWGLL